MKLLALLLCLLPCLSFAQVGDGRTDDTAAIQAKIAAGGLITLPPGTFRVTSTLRIDKLGVRIVGAGESTRIVMDADNRPIFAYVGDNLHSEVLDSLSLEYARPQNAYDHPRSSAVCVLNEDGKNRAGGVFRSFYRNLTVVNSARGFSVIRDLPGDQTSVNPWWGTTWESITFVNTARSLIDLNLGATGAPCNTFRRLLTMKPTNDGVGPALRLRGEIALYECDIEDWAGQILYVPSAGYVLIDSFHAERTRQGSDRGRLIELANCPLDGAGWVVTYAPGWTIPATVLFMGPNATGGVRAMSVLAPSGMKVTPTAGNVVTAPVSN